MCFVGFTTSIVLSGLDSVLSAVVEFDDLIEEIAVVIVVLCIFEFRSVKLSYPWLLTSSQ